LDTPLTVTRAGTGLTVTDAGTLIVEAEPVDPAGEPPRVVSYEEAVAASRTYPGFTDHPFPTCYVCGPNRTDGLRIFPGLLPGGRTAAGWQVPEDVAEVTVWAALD